MPGKPPTTLELTPEMLELIERLRGELSPQQLIRLLLQIADNPGSVSATPELVIELRKSK